MKVSTLHTAAVRMANGKVVEVAVTATSFGRNDSTLIDALVSHEGRKVNQHIGSIEHSSHPERTHAFYPAAELRKAGLGPTFGSLAEVRIGAVGAAMFRMGIAAAQVAEKVTANA